MLWLALSLPHLPLEVFSRGAESTTPLLVAEGYGSRRWVCARSRAAAEAGVHIGMELSAAQSLVRDGQIRPRAPAAEQAALEGLADWGGQFTSTLSLHPPHGLLLEIGGSRVLFGGIEPLQAAVRQGVEALGYRARLGIAPTPSGAWLLAHAGIEETILDRGDLHRRLAALPLRSVDLPADTVEALRGMGLHRLGDCLRLPRAGLARRLGPGLLDHLDRALGRVPDPRPTYTPPTQFAHRLVLPAEVESAPALLFAARRLLLELGGFLRAHQASVRHFALTLGHRGHPPSRMDIGLLSPSCDADHLQGLLQTRLDRFTLPAPVDEITLHADTLIPLEETHPDLFGDAPLSGEDWQHLVERLQARLGSGAIYGCTPHPDHRPEHAWRLLPPGQTEEGTGIHPPRPLWLLEPPLALAAVDGHPHRNGSLRLLHGPERIEGGWWEQQGTGRDYYVAEDRRHTRLWVFRERAQHRWFLHGLFA